MDTLIGYGDQGYGQADTDDDIIKWLCLFKTGILETSDKQ